MYFLGLGLVFLALKYFQVDPVAVWPWWQVLAPFGLAVAWWAWADASGYTKRKSMEREDRRTAQRRKRNQDALANINDKRKRK